MLWRDEFFEHCTAKYSNVGHPTSERVDAGALHKKYLQKTKEEEQLACVHPRFALYDVFQARMKMRKGGCGGGGSVLVPEMLRLLPLTFVYVVWRVMRARFLGITGENIASWCLILVTFLHKVRSPQNI